MSAETYTTHLGQTWVKVTLESGKQYRFPLSDCLELSTHLASALARTDWRGAR